MERLLQRSLHEGIPLNIIYLSTTNRITQRRIIVSHINELTIRAYCFLRGQTRMFRIDHILSVFPERKYG